MPDHDRKANPRAIDDPRVRTLLVAAALVVIAWLVYRPDRHRPFHILDFSEFIPLLLQGEGLIDRIGRVVEYYASQGRFNAIPYVLLGLKWDFFGWWTPGWQIARALLMVTNFGLAFVLLRRLSASRLGALAGASVYFWAPSAVDGWVRMTIAEPLGAAIVLSSSIRAVRFQATARWRREIALMALSAIALIWTKELMAPILVLPVCLALTVQRNGVFARPTLSRRNVGLMVGMAVATIAAMVPIAVLYLRAEEAAYASMYGRGMQSLTGILAIWVTMLVPFELVIVPANILWAVAIAGLVVLLAIGWKVGFNRSPAAKWLLALAVLVPLLGVLAYLPNPWYANFYTLPYLIGAALLIGMGATWLQETGPHGAALAVTTWVAILLHSSTSALNYATRTDAVQRRDEWVVAFVADSVEADSVQFATRTPPPYDWLGFGAAMTRISRARGRPWPPARNVSCASARMNLNEPSGLLTVNFESSCEFTSPTLHVISQRYRRLDVRRLRVVEDSAHADLILPRHSP